jgi:two-component system NarL family sensor kinase
MSILRNSEEVGDRMTPRTARWIAWAIVVIYFVLAAAGLTLQGIAHALYAQTSLPVLIFMVLLVGGWMVTGALIISRHPQYPVGWLLCAGLFFAAIDMFSAGYAAYDTYVFSGLLPGVVLALVWLKLVVLGPHGLVAFSLIILLFPDGRLPSPRWRKVAWTTVGALFLFLPLQAVEPGPIDPSFLQDRTNPLGVSPSLWAVLNLLRWMAFSILVLCYGAAFLSLIGRLRNAHDDVRQQIKWLVFPAGLYGIFLLLFIIGLAKADEAIQGLGIALGQLAIAGMVIAIAFAIFKYRLYDIDTIINRTLVYGTLTACVIGLYVLVVGALGTFFQAQGNLLIALLATGLVAVLFQPLRDRLQRGVNRLLYGERDDPVEALSRLGKQLETAGPPENLLLTLVETIAQTLKLPYVAITLPFQEGNTIAAAHGKPVAEVIHVPLIYQGEDTGQLVVGLRSPGSSLSPADMRLLRNIARQTGTAVHAVRLTDDLLRSRQELITAREEERRRIQRDLHDGLGATLAAFNLEAAILRRSIRSDPDTAEALVDDLRQDILDTIEEIRHPDYELRPPILDQLGLAEAVRLQAEQCSRPEALIEAPLQISVEAPESLPNLPAAVEVAAYRITQEALTNVVNHAAARHCVVRIDVGEGLHLEVVDDGVGISNGSRNSRGLGLNSMRERAEELGGACLVEPVTEGGTRVLAFLPLLEV